MQHPDDITQHPSDMLDVMQAAPEAGSMKEESLSGLPLHQVDTLVTEEANITAGHAEAGTGRLWEDRPLCSDKPTPQHVQTRPPHFTFPPIATHLALLVLPKRNRIPAARSTFT